MKVKDVGNNRLLPNYRKTAKTATKPRKNNTVFYATKSCSVCGELLTTPAAKICDSCKKFLAKKLHEDL